MKLEVYNPEPQATEQPVRLALRQQQQGGNVRVVAVDASGEVLPGGILLVFTKEGTIRRVGCIGNHGFRLDGRQRIEEEKG